MRLHLTRLLAITAVAAVSLAAQAAHAQTPGLEPHSIVAAVNKCLDATMAPNLVLRSCTRSTPQTWRIYPIGGIADYRFRLETDDYQRCVDAGRVYVPGNLAKLRPCEYQGGAPDSQVWRQVYVGSSLSGRSYYMLQNDYAGYCLASSWGYVAYMTAACNRATSRLWSALNWTYGWQSF
jgi:hypothetical protein